MTEAFTNFYSSDQLQKVDWKRTFQHMHALPYSRLVVDLRSDTRPRIIRIYSTVAPPPEPHFSNYNYVGHHLGSPQEDDTVYVWCQNGLMSSRDFDEHLKAFTSQQLEDKLHAVASRENYRVDVTKLWAARRCDEQRYRVYLQST